MRGLYWHSALILPKERGDWDGAVSQPGTAPRAGWPRHRCCSAAWTPAPWAARTSWEGSGKKLGKETSPVALGDCPAAQPPACRKAEVATKKEGAEGTPCPAPTLDTLKSSPEKETSAGMGQTPQTPHTGGRVSRRSSLGSSWLCWGRAVLQGKPRAPAPGAPAALAPSGCGFATPRGFALGPRECRHTPARAASFELGLGAARGLGRGELGLILLQLPQCGGSATAAVGDLCPVSPTSPRPRLLERQSCTTPSTRKRGATSPA